jgi:hypothetical protein
MAKDVQILERVQKRAVNMITGLTSLTYKEKLKELGIQSLKDRRTEADAVLAYKVIHGKCSVQNDCWPKLQNERGIDAAHGTRAARDGLRLRTPFARTDRRKNFYTVLVCETWNKIPVEIKSSKTIGQLKKCYRTFAASTTSEAMDNAMDN